MQSESFKRRLVVAVKNGFQWSKIYLTGSIKNNGRDLFLKASSPIKSHKIYLRNLVSCHKLNKKLIGFFGNYFGISDFTSIFVNNSTSKALKNINLIQIGSFNRLQFKNQILRKREKTETNFGKLKINVNPTKKNLTKLDLNNNTQVKRNKNMCHKNKVNHSNKLILNNDNVCKTKLNDTIGSKPLTFSYKTVSIMQKAENFKEKETAGTTNEKGERKPDNNQESLKITYKFRSPKYYISNLKIDKTIEHSQKCDTNVDKQKAIDFLVDSGSGPKSGVNIENNKQDNAVSNISEKTVKDSEKKIEECLWFESKPSVIDKQRSLDSTNNSRVNIKFVEVRDNISDKLTEDIFDYTNKESETKNTGFEKEFMRPINSTKDRISSVDINEEINSIKVTKANINQSRSRTFVIIEKHKRNTIENNKSLQSNTLKSKEFNVNQKLSSENIYMEKELFENLPELENTPERMVFVKGSEITHIPSANGLICENNPKNTSIPNKINDMIKIAIGKSFPVFLNKEDSDVTNKAKEGDKNFNSNDNKPNCTAGGIVEKKAISPLYSPRNSDKKFTTFFFDYSEMSEISNNVSNAIGSQIQCPASILNEPSDLEEPSQQEKSATLETDEFAFNLQKLDQTEVVNYFINRNKQMPNKRKETVKLSISTEIEMEESMNDNDKFTLYMLRPAEIAAMSEALILKQEDEFEEIPTETDIKSQRNLKNEKNDCSYTADISEKLGEPWYLFKKSQTSSNTLEQPKPTLNYELPKPTSNDEMPKPTLIGGDETIKKIIESVAECTETSNIDNSTQSNSLAGDHALTKMKSKIANPQSAKSDRKDCLHLNKEGSCVTNKRLPRIIPTEKDTYYFPTSTHLTQLVSELQGKMLQCVKSDSTNEVIDQNSDLNMKTSEKLLIGRNYNQQSELTNVSNRRKSFDKFEELKCEQATKVKPLLSQSIIKEHKKTFRLFAKKFEKMGLYKKRKSSKIQLLKSDPLDQRIPRTKSSMNIDLQPCFQNTPEGKRLQKCFLNLKNKLTTEMKFERKVYKRNNKFIFKKIGKLLPETSPSKYSFERKNTGGSSF